MIKKQNELIQQLTDKELMINFYLSQVIMIILAAVLIPLFFVPASHFLNLFNFCDLRILTIGGSAGLIIVLLDLLFYKFLPRSYFDDGGLNERLFSNRGAVRIFWMTLLVAFSEELLFRGVLQTKFGLAAASIIFAIVHFRYLHKPFLFISVVFISFWIGLIMEITNNLAVTMFMHFIIDFLLGLIIYFSKRSV